MKEFKFTIHGNEYEVEIKQLEEGIGKIEVNGTLYEVELHKKEEKNFENAYTDAYSCTYCKRSA